MPNDYFDYNATTPLDPEVFEVMEPFLKQAYGNPSSSHQMGQQAAQAIKRARRHAAELLGAAEDSEIIFTSGATESNNAAVRSALAANPQKREIIISAVEHSSIYKLCEQLKKEGYVIHEIEVSREGQLNLEALFSKLSDKVAIVSLMMANNETGILFPISEIGKEIRAKGILFHVDGVQAVGKEELSLKNSQVDYFSLSAHKFYGPKGIGALYVRRGMPFHPFVFGGSQERGRRGGTENLPGIVGLGAACAKIKKQFIPERLRLAGLRQRFEAGLRKRIPGIKITGEFSERLINTSHVIFDGILGETLLIALDARGIYASTGSACMSGSQDPSRVLKAMGYSDQEALSCARFSFGSQTDEAAVDVLIEALQDVVTKLREKNSSKVVYAG